MLSGHLERLEELCRGGRVLVFTGAGISADSGIPTFRGAGGLWKKYDVEKVASIGAFLRDPSHYWNFFREARLPALTTVRPNAAHEAVAEMERRGYLTAVVTQNIDGLHQAAGARDVFELHGNTTRFACISCSYRCDLETILELMEKAFPPTCPRCGAVMRPEVVLFGESLPSEALERSIEAARSSRLALCVGSSLVVHPAAMVPQYAEAVAIVNLERTPLDGVAEVVIRRRAAEVLPALVEALPPAPASEV